MRAWLKMLVVAGLVLGGALTGLGWLARWVPMLDLFNTGIPVVAAGALCLFVLALVLRDWRLIASAALLASINAALLLAGLQGAAPEADPDAARFLRVLTMNVLHDNERIDGAIAFIAETDADVVVLQEVAPPHSRELRQALGTSYTHSVGDSGVMILSKFPIGANGRIDRAGYPEWISLLARWVEIDVKGTPVEILGVHLARPFYPELQHQDIATLIQFARTRTLPLIVAGDFNLTPWTEQLKAFTRATGLKRYNTLHPTWPMRWRTYPLLPLFVIDNVFASDRLAKIATEGGPRLGSDHRPVIADIALAEQRSHTPQ